MSVIDADATTAADEHLRAAHGTTAGRTDPYPHYAAMREIAPLYRSGLDGVWYVTRYDDCKGLLHDPRAGRGPHRPAFGVAEARAEAFNRRFGATMILQNPPEHTRLRGLARAAFTARRVEAMRAHIRDLAAPMLESLAESGGGDLVSTLAFPLPVTVIAELVGVPAEDRELFRGFFGVAAAAFAPGADAAALAAAATADTFIDSYFGDLLARRRARPTDDLISALAAVRDERGPLTDDEIVCGIFLLFSAGFGTTTHAIGSGVRALLRDPDQTRLLWAAPGLAAGAAEEMLRYESPAQFVRRVALREIEWRGVVIEAGDDIVALPGAANRDPERFPDPDRFDITRIGNVPLSFGWGIHHCLGAALARLELQTVLELFVARFSSVSLVDPDQRGPRTSWFLRGLDSLPVHVTPRR
jgi:cytochrome P450